MSETDPIIDLEERLFEEMGDPKATSRENKAIMRKLLYVFVLITFFTAIKIAGGILSGSIAIIADAAHMFTDFIALLIAIVSVWISSFKANRAHSYGFHRAGIIGALASVIVLWVLIGFLVYYGIMRIINHEQIVIRGEIMFGVACVGLIINLIMINILHHTKKNSYPHYPSKSSQVIAEAQASVEPCNNVAGSFYTGSAQEVVHSAESKIPQPESPSEEQIEYMKRNLDAAPLEAAVHPYENEVQERTGYNKELARKKAAAKRARNLSIVEARDNINVRATVIHILGDILQSVTVIIVSILIWAFPEDTRIADPITTLVFAFIIFVSSIKILKDCVFVLMESTPDGFILEDFEKEMMEIEGVEEIHDLHVWTLGVGKHSMSAHLYASKNEGYVLNKVTALCRSHGIYHTTVQIETQRDQEHEDYLDCKHNLHAPDLFAFQFEQ